MLKINFLCNHYSTIVNSNKNLLSKLRKTTGCSFVNCKDALEKFDNDLKKAEIYLKDRAEKEGWIKATKLQSRHMSQGLIGIICHNHAASIVEVNCETDFVSRNAKFKNLTTLICCALHFHGLELSIPRISYSTDELSKLEINGRSISELTALEIGSLGENIVAKRGIFRMASNNQHITYYVHETGPKIDTSMGLCNFGKYGALVLYTRDLRFVSLDQGITSLPTEQVGRELCQHIVGMNPLYIDRDDPVDSILSVIENENGVKDKEEVSVNSNKAEPSNDVETLDEVKHLDEESRLLRQEFMLNTDITVGIYMRQQGANVDDFVRFECGEELKTSNDLEQNGKPVEAVIR